MKVFPSMVLWCAMGALSCAGAVQRQHSRSVFLQTRDSSHHNEAGSISIGGSGSAGPMHDAEFGDIRLQYAEMAGRAAETVLNEAGYQSVAKLENSTETSFFIRRLLNTMDLTVATGGAERMHLFAANYSGENGTSTNLESLKQEIRRVSRVPQSWVSQTGTSTPLNEEGFALVVALGRSTEMSRFVHRVAADLLDKRIADAKKLRAFVSFYDGKLARRSFKELVNDLRTVSLDDVENFLAPAHEPLKHGGEDCRRDCKKTGFCEWCGAGNACCKEKDAHSPQECKAVLNAYLTSSSECMEVVSGSNAPMSQAGYETLLKLKNNTEMERYFLRLADTLDYDVTSHSSLMGVVPFYSGMKAARSFGALVEELELATSPRTGANAWLVLRPESERHERDDDDEDEVAMFLKARDGGDEDEGEDVEKFGRKHRHRRHKRRASQPKMSAAEKAQVLGINKDSVDAEDDEMQIALGLKEATEGQEEALDYAAAAQGSQEAVKKTAKAFGMNAASLTEEEKELAMALASEDGSGDNDLEAGHLKGKPLSGNKLAAVLDTNTGSLSEEEEEEMAVALGLKDGPKGSNSAKETKESEEEVKMIDGKQLAAALGADLGSVSAEEDEMAIALGLKDAPEDADPEKGAVLAAEKTRGEELAAALGRDADAGTLSEEEGEMAIALGLIEPPESSDSESAGQASLRVKALGGEELASALGAEGGSLSEEQEEMAIALGVKPPPEAGTMKDDMSEDATDSSVLEGPNPMKAEVMAAALGTEVGSMTEEEEEMAIALGLKPAEEVGPEHAPAGEDAVSLTVPESSSKMEQLAVALGSDAGTLSEEEEEMAVALGQKPAASVQKRGSQAEVAISATVPDKKPLDVADLAVALHADESSVQQEDEEMAIALGKKLAFESKGVESPQKTSEVSSQGIAPHKVDLASALGMSRSAVEEEEAEMVKALDQQVSPKVAGHHRERASKTNEQSSQKIKVVAQQEKSGSKKLDIKGTHAQELEELSIALGERKSAPKSRSSSRRGFEDEVPEKQNALAIALGVKSVSKTQDSNQKGISPAEGPHAAPLVRAKASNADIANVIGTDVASVTEEAEMMAVALGEKPTPNFENQETNGAAEDAISGDRKVVNSKKVTRAMATQKAKATTKRTHAANLNSRKAGHAGKARQNALEKAHGLSQKATSDIVKVKESHVKDKKKATKGTVTMLGKGKIGDKKDMPAEKVTKHNEVVPKATELPPLSMMAEQVDEQEATESSLGELLGNRNVEDVVMEPKGDDLASALAAATMAERAALGATPSPKAADLLPLSMMEDASTESESPRSYAPLGSGEKTLDQLFAKLR